MVTKKKPAKKTSAKKAKTLAVSAEKAEAPLKVDTSKKYWWVAVLVLIVGGLWLTRGLWVVATVNNEPIWRYTIVKQLEQQAGAAALEEQVTQILIIQEAQKQNLTVSAEEIDSEVEKFKQQLEEQGQGLTLEVALAQQGITEEDLRKNIMFQKYIEVLLADKVEVSDDETKEYFDLNQAFFGEEQTLEDVKDQVVAQVKSQKLQQEFQPWMAEIRDSANITNFFEY